MSYYLQSELGLHKSSSSSSHQHFYQVMAINESSDEMQEGAGGLQIVVGKNDFLVEEVGTDSDVLAVNEMQDPADLQIVVDKDDSVIEEIGIVSEVQGSKKHTEIIEPRKGMMVDSVDDAIAFYERYAQKNGFDVKHARSKSENGKLRYFTLACSRWGTLKNKPTPSPSNEMNCPAKLNFSLYAPEDKYRLTSLTLEHNHSLRPRETRVIDCQHKPDLCGKRRRASNSGVEVHASKNLSSSPMQVGGHENHKFGEDKNQREVKQEKRPNLGARDAHVLKRYFLRMQSNNPKFFYVMDFDEDSQLRNVFWADARSRAAYESFSDVVKFGVTYLTNKYERHFASFMGVNHHGESIILGCGLLANDDTESFVWLFKSWLACMSNKPPKGIITVECKAMLDAAEEVFPESNHRWCLCNIMKKIHEKLRALSEFENIRISLSNMVYESLTKSDFEKGWVEMIGKFGLQNNKWLTGLYVDRQKWVPAYLKDTFWAGLCSSKECECEHPFFDGCVNPTTTLNQFLEQYSNAVRDMVEKEKTADCKSFQEVTPCITHYDIEKQFQLLYTNKKFEEFQEQLKDKIYCYPLLLGQENSIYVFRVEQDVKLGEQQLFVEFTVWLKGDGCEVRCMCRHFEFQGILCSHIISVLVLMKFKEVPSKYVLQRWRKGLDRSHTSIRCSYDNMVDSPVPRRFDELCRSFYEVAEQAATSDDLFNMVMDGIRDSKVKVEAQLALHDNQKAPAEHQDVEM